jgi:hypothetical protein
MLNKMGEFLRILEEKVCKDSDMTYLNVLTNHITGPFRDNYEYLRHGSPYIPHEL